MQKNFKIVLIFAIIATCSFNCGRSKDSQSNNEISSVVAEGTKGDTTVSRISFKKYQFSESTEIPILEFYALSWEEDSLLDTATDNYLTVGHGNADSTTSIFYRPKPELYYHVISPFGRDLYKDHTIQKSQILHCEDESIDCWKISFDYSALADTRMKEQYLYGFIVVGSKQKLLFNSPIVKIIPDSIKTLCKKILLQSDTTEYRAEIISAGYQKSIWRILLTFNGPIGEGFMAVMDTDGTRYRVLFKTNDHWSDGRYYVGQADLDYDGFSDVFLLNYGDYGAFNIFVERNGKWIVIHNHGPQTC